MDTIKRLIGFLFVMSAPFLVGGVVGAVLIKEFGSIGLNYFFLYSLVWLFLHVGWFDGSSFQRLW